MDLQNSRRGRLPGPRGSASWPNHGPKEPERASLASGIWPSSWTCFSLSGERSSPFAGFHGARQFSPAWWRRVFAHEAGETPAAAVTGWFRGRLTCRGGNEQPNSRSELRSLGQAEAYPTKSPAFPMWGKLRACPAGRQPGLGLRITKSDEAQPAMFFNRVSLWACAAICSGPPIGDENGTWLQPKPIFRISSNWACSSPV